MKRDELARSQISPYFSLETPFFHRNFRENAYPPRTLFSFHFSRKTDQTPSAHAVGPQEATRQGAEPARPPGRRMRGRRASTPAAGDRVGSGQAAAARGQGALVRSVRVALAAKGAEDPAVSGGRRDAGGERRTGPGPCRRRWPRIQCSAGGPEDALEGVGAGDG